MRTRAIEIVRVLGRHGAGHLRDVVLRRPRRSRRRGSGAPATGPGHLRAALEELGPTFVKLGQILSTRSDLLPSRYVTELALLQDAAPRLPWPTVDAAVRAELGAPCTEAFGSIEQEPIAAASIGQVHGAVLPDGRDVVIKVRRPGIVAVVDDDLALLTFAARRASSRWSPLRAFEPDALVDEFAQTIRGELDYLAEGRNADRLRALLAPTVHVPTVDWDRTTTAVLTLERIRGVKVDDLAGLDQLGVDRRTLAKAFAETWLSMVFVHGVFHADPHPGNVFVEPGGRLALVDFGMVGVVPPALADGLADVLVGVALHDVDRLVRATTSLGFARRSVDERALRADLDGLVARSMERPLGEMEMGALLRELMVVIHRHRLVLPRDLALLVKTVSMCEGVARVLDPEFLLPVVLLPYVQAAIARRGGS